MLKGGACLAVRRYLTYGSKLTVSRTGKLKSIYICPPPFLSLPQRTMSVKDVVEDLAEAAVAVEVVDQLAQGNVGEAAKDAAEGAVAIEVADQVAQGNIGTAATEAVEAEVAETVIKEL